jgi:hypothetical protein
VNEKSPYISQLSTATSDFSTTKIIFYDRNVLTVKGSIERVKCEDGCLLGCSAV